MKLSYNYLEIVFRLYCFQIVYLSQKPKNLQPCEILLSSMDLIREFGSIVPSPAKTRGGNNMAVKVSVISPVEKRY
jgi:hypothetical protein